MLSKLKKIFKKETEYYTSKQKIIELLKLNNPVILEAGACEGYDTEEWSILLPNAQIHSFEPVSTNYELAKTRTNTYNNVNLYNLGLSDKTEKTEIYVSKNINNSEDSAFSSSLLKPKDHLTTHKHIAFEEKEVVQSVNLDEWAQENNLDKIDFMWLDLQGMEYKVLQAAPRILSTVSAIYTEVSHIELYEGLTLYPEYKSWLESQGFKVLREDLRYDDAGDVLFVRS